MRPPPFALLLPPLLLLGRCSDVCGPDVSPTSASREGEVSSESWSGDLDEDAEIVFLVKLQTPLSYTGCSAYQDDMIHGNCSTFRTRFVFELSRMGTGVSMSRLRVLDVSSEGADATGVYCRLLPAMGSSGELDAASAFASLQDWVSGGRVKVAAGAVIVAVAKVNDGAWRPPRAPVRDCVGGWARCGLDCGRRRYVVTTPRSGSGIPCPAASGMLGTFCVAGEGECPQVQDGHRSVAEDLVIGISGVLTAVAVFLLSLRSVAKVDRSRYNSIPKQASKEAPTSNASFPDDSSTEFPDPSSMPLRLSPREDTIEATYGAVEV
jgi:hypothetical protein